MKFHLAVFLVLFAVRSGFAQLAVPVMTEYGVVQLDTYFAWRRTLEGAAWAQ